MNEFFHDPELEAQFNLTPQSIIEQFNIEKAKEILQALGATENEERAGYVIFPTICHNPVDNEKSMKLYYYDNYKRFTCFTECGCSYSIFDLVRKVFETNGDTISFFEAFQYVLGFFKYSDLKVAPTYKSIANNYHRGLTITTLPEYNINISNSFRHLYIWPWMEENISAEVLQDFQIGFSLRREKITIPHFDIDGRFIGLRGRALMPYEIENYGKYMPMKIDGEWLSHPLSLNLYGAYNNKQAIVALQRVIVFESEKSVLKSNTFYGKGSVAVATCGYQLHKVQVDILVKLLQVQEIIIAFDKEYNTPNSPEGLKYQKKMVDICRKYSNYANMSFIFDNEGLLDEKDSPIDKTKEIFDRLYERRIKVK